MTEEMSEHVPKEQRAGWSQFIKSIATFSGDLSSLTAPSFILSPTSLVDWGEHPESFAQVKQGRDDVERLANVLKWFIGTLKGQYTARNESSGSEKKPLNPILGELFLGKWADTHGFGETTLTAEQVSHHPPITAYHLENAKAGVRLDGHSAQKTSFTGRAIQVRQLGHAILRFTPDGESAEQQYLITLPQLVIEGLLYGAPYIELQGTSYIQSSTGYLATINYSGRGWVSGKAHSFKATISPSAAPTQAFYTIEGEWHKESRYKGKSATGAKDAVFWDADKTPRVEIQVKSVEEQEPMESRRVWAVTAAGIRKGDYDTASKDKSRIENEQRAKRKTEAAESKPHQLRFFAHEADDPTYSALTAMFHGKPPKEDYYRFIASS
ncbi:Oxysterol-binding protein 4 [Tilletia horrida]|uniref:Oxysterol-binding protein 4 n=1 Tax=Tilletia horrida TaxID=155126 RepID=A0AAN6JU15_9BASI|nr:Oxysterol-binding protein 4 [Tilletia horrida]KAK0556387.1 Oxysterol-binding protein 4 [Tilletia horrida]